MKNKRNYVQTIEELGLTEAIKETYIKGLYVTENGRVFGTDIKGIYEIQPYVNTYTTKAENKKKYNCTKYGYYKFHYNSKIHRVHALVGRCFVDGYKEGLCLDHINNNSLDNRAENLQWITRSENTKKFWDSMTEEELIEYKQKFSEGLKEAHKKGNYKEHLSKLHNKGDNND